MTKVYKYALSIAKTELILPVGAKILHVAFQNTVLQLWAEVDVAENSNKEIRTFHVICTGDGINEENKVFIGTVFTGPFVLHVFEVPN